MSVKTLAVKLDEEVPDWFDRINLNDLNLDHSDTCILGQVYGDYTAESAVYVSWANNDIPEFDDNKYRPAWIKEIQQRRAAVQQQQQDSGDLEAFKVEMRDAILAGTSTVDLLGMVGGVSSHVPGTVLLLKNGFRVIRTGDNAWILVNSAGGFMECGDAYVTEIGVDYVITVDRMD